MQLILCKVVGTRTACGMWGVIHKCQPRLHAFPTKCRLLALDVKSSAQSKHLGNGHCRYDDGYHMNLFNAMCLQVCLTMHVHLICPGAFDNVGLRLLIEPTSAQLFH